RVGAQAGQTLADGAIRGVTTGGCFAAAASGVAFAVGSFHAQCAGEREHDQVGNDCYRQGENQGGVFHGDHTTSHEHGDGQHGGNDSPENAQPLWSVFAGIRNGGGEVGHDHGTGVSRGQVEQQTRQGS